MPVTDDLVLKTVVLCVDAGRQDKDTFGKLGVIFLSPCHQAIFVLQVAAIFPYLAEAGVVNNLHFPSVSLCIQELQDNRRPCCPLGNKGS